MPQQSNRYMILPDDLKIVIDCMALGETTVQQAILETREGEGADPMAKRIRLRQLDALLGRIRHLKKRFERGLA